MSRPALKSREVQLAQVDGLRIAYERAGEGPPLVLLHGGFGLDRRSWRWQLDGLADEFTVVAWDTPGCAESQDPPNSFDSRDYADCLAAFIDAVGLRRPHIGGLSFGSVLALEFYRHHPSVPRSLLLAGALPRIKAPTLLLHGDADQSAPLSVAQDLHQKIPGSRLVVMPGVGHFSSAEFPERFNSKVCRFVRSMAN